MFKLPMVTAHELNERLLAAVRICSYEKVLHYLIEGARATLVSDTCGRNAVTTAALVGDAEILELLIQSCEEPELKLFQKTTSKTQEVEFDSTPDGMDNLEWEDEFLANCEEEGACAVNELEQQHTSLYYYYAKTFERTGAIISSIENSGFHSTGLPQDPHNMDAYLMAPLHYASGFGHLECVSLLLDHGADPNQKTMNSGDTSMLLAIKNRFSDVANLIIESNANINETDDLDQTPLMCAIARGLDSVAYTLIDRGARVNLHDKYGHTALYYAVTQNNLPMAERLLEIGARRFTSHYLLHKCVHYNFKQMAELLLDNDLGESLNVRNQDGVSPLWLAVVLRNVDMLQFLLTMVTRFKYKVDSVMDHVEDELMVAVNCFVNAKEFLPIARVLFAYSKGYWLVDMQMLPNCQKLFCKSPLARAIMLNKFDIAEFLIKEGVDIDQICHEHVQNHIRTVAVGGVELVHLMIHAGYKFPAKKIENPEECEPECVQFEEEVQNLNAMPLSLQSLSRIVIRRQIINVLRASTAAYTKYMPTFEDSSVALMIKELEIPIPLKRFLIYYDDLPPVKTGLRILACAGVDI